MTEKPSSVKPTTSIIPTNPASTKLATGADVEVLVQGLVAAILTARELVINRGRADGVKRGMRFKVLSDKPIEVKDPETKAILGSIDREKVRVEATTVQEHMTICKTFRIIGTRGGAINDLAVMFEKYQEIPETLKAEQSMYTPPLSEAESFVKIGDRVVQLGPNE
jgi:hypothetical protein